MTNHTPGRMTHSSLMGSITVGSRDEAIFHCGLGLRHGNFGHEQVENARRLVACWNALEGIPTEEIESVQINDKALKDVAETCLEMLEALQLILPMAKGYAYQYPVGSNEAYCEQAKAVIAKVTGEAP